MQLTRIAPGHYTYKHLSIVQPLGTVNSAYRHWLIKDGHSIVTRLSSLKDCRQHLSAMQQRGKI